MSSEKEAKLKALQLTLDKLDKTYGKGTVMKMGDKAIVEVETISSGSLGIDLALGVPTITTGTDISFTNVTKKLSISSAPPECLALKCWISSMTNRPIA